MPGFFTISVVGRKPRSTAPHCGSASAIWIAKLTAMTPSSETMKEMPGRLARLPGSLSRTKC